MSEHTLDRPEPEYLATLTDRARRYIADLEAIVARLDTTADGAPVTLDLEVWCRDPATQRRFRCKVLSLHAGWCHLIEAETHTLCVPFTRDYDSIWSTEAAAEAAGRE